MKRRHDCSIRCDVPYLRRIHPEPEVQDSDRLRQFVNVAGFKLPKVLDRKSIQALLPAARGKPEAHAINLAILKSLTRAEYSPQKVGHYALASEAYCHFTSPIRRYADLTVHRLLDAYLEARDRGIKCRRQAKTRKLDLQEVPSRRRIDRDWAAPQLHRAPCRGCRARASAGKSARAAERANWRGIQRRGHRNHQLRNLRPDSKISDRRLNPLRKPDG